MHTIFIFISIERTNNLHIAIKVGIIKSSINEGEWENNMIQWESQYELGIKSIDDQHKKLIEITY